MMDVPINSYFGRIAVLRDDRFLACQNDMSRHCTPCALRCIPKF